jgi:hypothetical protein
LQKPSVLNLSKLFMSLSNGVDVARLFDKLTYHLDSISLYLSYTITYTEVSQSCIDECKKDYLQDLVGIKDLAGKSGLYTPTFARNLANPRPPACCDSLNR